MWYSAWGLLLFDGHGAAQGDDNMSQSNCDLHMSNIEWSHSATK